MYEGVGESFLNEGAVTPAKICQLSAWSNKKLKNVPPFFMLRSDATGIRTHALLVTCYNSKSKHWGNVTYFVPR
jgi:hypothetical protein